MEELRAALAGLVALGAIAGPAAADDRLALATAIVATVSDEVEMQYFDASLPFYMNAIQQSVRLTEAEQERITQLLREEYVAALAIGRRHRAETYARIFTESDLRDILDFYNSGAGRRFLEAEPQITDDNIQLQNAMNAAVMENAVQRLLEERGQGHF